ncbi:hypothetical protein M2138_000053 [Dysgonomonadaceae bacterium PH5-43]|nr:hypothetical protein [Dysgonomonadaceae bacterium PH5-43]
MKQLILIGKSGVRDWGLPENSTFVQKKST